MTDGDLTDQGSRPPARPTPTLRQQLETRFNQVRDEALGDPGSVTASHVEEVERLARLVQIQDQLYPQPKPRWPVAGAMLLTLVLISLLLFVRIREADVELDLVLSEVAFELTQDHVLTEVLQVGAIAAFELRSVQMPYGSAGGDRSRQADAGGRPAVQLEAEGTAGDLTLEPLTLPAGTRVLLSPTLQSNKIRLTLSGPDLLLRVGVRGRVRVSMPGTAAQTVDHPTPASVELRSSEVPLHLDLSLPEGRALRFAPALSVKSLVLDSVEEHLGGERSVVRQVSAIRSGSLFWEELGGREHRLRASERLRLKGAEGSLRMLRYENQQLQLSFAGQVRDVLAGAGRSLMPTWLDWLQAQHGLSLLWGATLYTFGILMGALRWWGWRA